MPRSRSQFTVRLALVVAMLTSCSSSSAPPPAGRDLAPAKLRSAVDRTRAAGTAEVEIAYRIPGVERPLHVIGVTALDGSRSRMRVDMRELGIPIEGDSEAVLVAVAGQVWMRPPPALMPLPPGIAWVELPAGSAGTVDVFADLDLSAALRDGDAVELDHAGRITLLRHVRWTADGARVETTVSLSNFGVPIEVAPPPPAETVDAEELG